MDLEENKSNVSLSGGNLFPVTSLKIKKYNNVSLKTKIFEKERYFFFNDNDKEIPYDYNKILVNVRWGQLKLFMSEFFTFIYHLDLESVDVLYEGNPLTSDETDTCLTGVSSVTTSPSCRTTSGWRGVSLKNSYPDQTTASSSVSSSVSGPQPQNSSQSSGPIQYLQPWQPIQYLQEEGAATGIAFLLYFLLFLKSLKFCNLLYRIINLTQFLNHHPQRKVIGIFVFFKPLWVVIIVIFCFSIIFQKRSQVFLCFDTASLYPTWKVKIIFKKI